MQMSDLKDGKFAQWYILTGKDTIGVEKKRSTIGRNVPSEYRALKGALFYMKPSRTDTRFEKRFASLECRDREIVTVETDLKPLNEKQYEILSSIDSCNERITFMQKPLFADLMTAEVGDMVTVSNHNTYGRFGTICSIGRMREQQPGFFFGIQFQVSGVSIYLDGSNILDL
jgi:hypothetical protein